jgi:hypothetical protein
MNLAAVLQAFKHEPGTDLLGNLLRGTGSGFDYSFVAVARLH